MKHITLCKEYEQGGLKDMDIFSKITSLHCSWVKRLYDDSFHASKVIPLYLIKNDLDNNFIFHSNLSTKQKIVEKFINQEIITRKFLSSLAKVLSAVASQFIWYNEYVKIDNNTIYYCCFSQKKINHINDLFENNGKTRIWEDLRGKLDLDDTI